MQMPPQQGHLLAHSVMELDTSKPEVVELENASVR